MTKIITNNEKETIEFAKKFATKLKGGEIIGLSGDLGAGKTIFTKGLAQGLGIKEMITSPTFVLMKVYPITKRGSKIKQLVHVDAYRLEQNTDISTVGIEEYLNRDDTVVAIEWPEKITNCSFKKSKKIIFKNIKEEERLIIIK
jgi:tRNA threonylcarbamoyladenosine biosynthesis protein TsaE